MVATRNNVGRAPVVDYALVDFAIVEVKAFPQLQLPMQMRVDAVRCRLVFLRPARRAKRLLSAACVKILDWIGVKLEVDVSCVQDANPRRRVDHYARSDN